MSFIDSKLQGESMTALSFFGLEADLARATHALIVAHTVIQQPKGLHNDQA